MKMYLQSIFAYLKLHIEKCVFLSLLLIFCIILIALGLSYSLDKEEDNPVDSIIRKISLMSGRYQNLIVSYKEEDYVKKFVSQKSFSYYGDVLSRDIFREFKIEDTGTDDVKNPYILKDIIRKECPFVWKGIVKDKNGNILFAQLNYDKETFFVKENTVVKGYRVLKINSMYVELKNEDVKEKVILELNKPTLEGTVVAKIVNKDKKTETLVKEGDMIDGWMVSLIASQHVRLKKDDVLVYLRK